MPTSQFFEREGLLLPISEGHPLTNLLLGKFLSFYSGELVFPFKIMRLDGKYILIEGSKTFCDSDLSVEDYYERVPGDIAISNVDHHWASVDSDRVVVHFQKCVTETSFQEVLAIVHGIWQEVGQAYTKYAKRK